MKRLVWLIVTGLCLQLGFGSLAQAAPETALVKELNFVFLHGAGGTACSMQLLADQINEQLPELALAYEKANPGVKIRADSLLRCYPNDVDIKTWAENIAWDTINKYLPDRKNLVLIGHSVGGKAALYAVAQNIGNIADKVIMVVTIDSPIKSMQNYYFAGGATAADFYRARWLLPSWGVADSVVYYDSSRDGKLVASAKHWLAFVSAESAPLSPQFDVGGIDPLPRDMDDGAIPISAQYSDGADVVYYGEYFHNDFGNQDKVASSLAKQILTYLFGGKIECSVLARTGSFEHKAGWLPVTDTWDDIVGEIPASSGSVQHQNESFTSWQEWEDVVGESTPGDKRSSYQINQVAHFPFLAGVEEVRWLSPDNPDDYRLYIKTRAAPRNNVQVDWSTYRRGLLPARLNRDRYEVEIILGTPLTNINRVEWASDDPTDLRLMIHSEVESPFRWFNAEWKTYIKESIERKVIDDIPPQPASASAQTSQWGNRCCN